MLSEVPLCGRTRVIYPPPAEGRPGCFPVWATINKAATHVRVQVACGRKFPPPLGKRQGARLRDRVVRMRSGSHEAAALAPTAAASPWLHVLAARGAVGVRAVAVLTGVRRCLAVLICSSLVARGAKHRFLCSSAVCASSGWCLLRRGSPAPRSTAGGRAELRLCHRSPALASPPQLRLRSSRVGCSREPRLRCQRGWGPLVKAFGPFFNQVVGLLIVEFEEFFYVWGNSPLSDVSSANFSVSVFLIS